MKPKTIDALITALDEIDNQFYAIQNGKSEKNLQQMTSAILDAKVALLTELPEVEGKAKP